MRFTLRQLQYFVATGEHGSIARASEAISISQASISASISHLEAEFAVPLFLRHHAQGLTLTAAGLRLLREARLLLGQAENLYVVADELATQVRGPLTVGWFATMAPIIAPELCHAFAEAFPEVRLTQVEGDQQELLQGLRQATLDIAVLYDMEIPSDIGFEPLACLPPFVLLAADHPLAGRASVTLEEMAPEPMILLDLPISRDYFLSLFHAAGLAPLVANRSAQMETIRTMVANGYGYALANLRARSDRALDGKRLVSVTLEGSHRPLMMGLAAPAQPHRTRLIETFAQHCHGMVAGMGLAPAVAS